MTTPTELAEKFAPAVREASERAKADILASLPGFKRAIAKAAWAPAMKHGVPIELRIVIELAIGKYQEYLAPYMDDILPLLQPLLDVKTHPELQPLLDILEILQTKKELFHPAVIATLNPSLAHGVPAEDEADDT
jgi:hypothetical protein